jgi:histidine triad (HIT) family protein
MTASHPHELEDCPFCAIARGEDRSVEMVCEAGSWVAFFPVDPATPGHTLVIPRLHVPNLWELPSSLAAEMMDGVIKVGRAINAALAPEGMNMITSAGKAAEQTILHLHLHLVPRWARDGFGPIWPREERYEDASLEGIAERIREACKHA